MAAEAYAVFQVVETIVEGAVVGAIAVRKPTVPVHITFHKIPSPSNSLARSSHSLNIVKGKAYIFGGDLADGRVDNSVRMIGLPSDLALQDTDYQLIKPTAAPVRPLAAYSDHVDEEGFTDTQTTMHSNVEPEPRAAHASTTIDSDVFIIGGRPPQDETGSTAEPADCGTVHSFSTVTHQWTTLAPQTSKCAQGLPQPRTYASCTSTEHPLPGSTQNATTEAHGTIFLHGGYDAQGTLLRDVWTFDVSSRVWARWPDIPSPGPEDVAFEGSICCVESRLWRVGDGFGKVMYLDIVRDDADHGSGKSELGVSPKDGKWRVLSFVETSAEQTQSDAEKLPSPVVNAGNLPMPRKGAGYVPISTGAGREYLLYFMGEDGPGSTVKDAWTFQIEADKSSMAKLKDKIRNTIGQGTGENLWARAEFVETTKEDGTLPIPQGLSRFASDAWRDFGGGEAVFWGGKTADGEVMNEGWVVTVK